MANPTPPTSLRTNELVNPTGLTDTHPEFDAIFNDNDGGDTTTTANIEVASASGNFALVNLVPNPSFESLTGGWADDWTRSDATIFTIDTGGLGAHTDPTNSLKIVPDTPASAENIISTNFITVDDAKTYIFSFFGNVESYIDSEIDINIEEYESDDSWEAAQNAGNIQNADADQFAYEYTPTNANVAKVKINFKVYTASDFTCYIDDVRLYEKVANNTGAKVSITVDDGRISLYNNRANVASYGIPLTWYIVDDYVFDNSADANFAAWAEIKTCYDDYGWEIGNHTVNHVDLQAANEATIITEIDGCADSIETEIGVRPTTFAYPFGTYDQLVREISARYAFASLDYAGSERRNVAPYAERMSLVRSGVENSHSLATVKGWIDNAISNNEWIILSFHNFVASGPAQYEWTIADFLLLLSYIRVKVNAGDILATTVKEGANLEGADMWRSDDITITSTAVEARSPKMEYRGTSVPIDGSTFSWRVRFIDNGASVGEWSGTATFATSSATTSTSSSTSTTSSSSTSSTSTSTTSSSSSTSTTSSSSSSTSTTSSSSSTSTTSSSSSTSSTSSSTSSSSSSSTSTSTSTSTTTSLMYTPKQMNVRMETTRGGEASYF